MKIGQFDPTEQLPDTAADSIGPGGESSALLEAELGALQDRYAALPASTSATDRAQLQLEIGHFLAELDRGAEAWQTAEPAARTFIDQQDWERTVEAFDILFRADQDGSLAALGQGVWLAVTFPVDPELSVTMLQHIVDETPSDSDGAAVAAAVAMYVVDMRCDDEKKHHSLSFFANQMLGNVARRHSEVETQEAFDFWFKKLELHDPALFLPRLRNVVDVLVQDDWWFDRDAVRDTLPED